MNYDSKKLNEEDTVERHALEISQDTVQNNGQASAQEDIRNEDLSSAEAMVARQLRQSKQITMETIKTKAIRFLHGDDVGLQFAASLAAIPFNEKTIETLSREAKETLHEFISKVVLLYVLSLNSPTLSLCWRSEMSQWATKCIWMLLNILQLDTTIFVNVVNEVLELLTSGGSVDSTPLSLFRQIEKTHGSLNFSPTSQEDVCLSSFTMMAKETEPPKPVDTSPQTLPMNLMVVLNPQPTKSQLNSEGHFAALQLSINADYDASVHRDMLWKLLSYDFPLSDSHDHPTQTAYYRFDDTSHKMTFDESSDTDVVTSEGHDATTNAVRPLVRKKKSKENIATEVIQNASQHVSPYSTVPYTDYFRPDVPTTKLKRLLGTFIDNPPPALAVVLRDLFFAVAAALDIPENGLLLAVQEELSRKLTLSKGLIFKETKESSYQKNIRRIKVAGVAAGLGSLTALTVGLTAPAIAAGFGALGIAGMSGAVSFMATTGGSATLASLFGAGTAGFSGWKYFRRVEKIKVFRFDRLQPFWTASCHTEVYHAPWKWGVRDPQKATEHSPSDKSRTDVLKNTELVTLSLPHSSNGKTLTMSINLVVPTSASSLCVVICISGWLRDLLDIWKPWRGLRSSLLDVYALRWDPVFLLDLGTFMFNLLSQSVAVTAMNLWLRTTIVSSLSLALMWPITLIQYASRLDNTWMMCRERATQGGKLLAKAIADEKTVGCRPVTLIGFSTGARIIHSCLSELHRLKMFNRVQHAILIGSPVSCDRVAWQRSREVVSGRLVNVYCSADWLLAFLFRYMEWGITVAGLYPVKVAGVENFNVTGIITSHGQYADKINDILAFIGYHAMENQTQPVKQDDDDEFMSDSVASEACQETATH